jgi:hypothetical protein
MVCPTRPDVVVGMVVVVADTLVMTVDESFERIAVPFPSVTRFEISRGQKRRTVTGAVAGLFIGAAVGVVVEIVAGYERGKRICSGHIDIVGAGPPSTISCRDEPDRWGSPSWRGVTIGAALGAIVGGLGGSRRVSDRWEEIPLEQVSIRVTKQSDGRFLLGASVRF